MFRCFAVFILVILILFSSASAFEGGEAPTFDEIQAQQEAALDLGQLYGALPDGAGELLKDFSVTDSLDLDKSLSLITSAASEQAGGIIRRALRSAAMVFTVTVLVSIAGSVYDSGAVPDFIPLAGVMAVSAIALGDLRSFIGYGVDTLLKISDFSKVLLPCLAAAAVSAGAVTSASAKYLATVAFVEALLGAAVKLIMPLVYAYTAVTIANAALGTDGLGGVSGILKWSCITVIAGLMLAFTGYLSLTGVISGSADAIASRALKSAVSTVLPVVGSIVGDAASTLLAAAGVLRNAVGIFGMVAVSVISLSPFLTLGIHYLAYKGAAGLAATLPDKRLGGIISGIGSVFGIVLSLVGSGAVMLFISIISSIKAVTG